MCKTHYSRWKKGKDPATFIPRLATRERNIALASKRVQKIPVKQLALEFNISPHSVYKALNSFKFKEEVVLDE